jgi:hypothetical protein
MKNYLASLLASFLILSLNGYAEMRQDGSYIAPTSVKGICQELEKSITAYNKGWVESNKAWADALNAKKTNDLSSLKNNSDLLKSSLDDVVGRWNKLECTSIIYQK